MATFGPREVTRLLKVYASPSIVQQRARTLSALAMRPGERGLDVGCGPAFLTVELARAVGDGGRVTGLDASPEMREAASARLEQAGLLPRVDLVAGDAGRLDFPDGAFDFVVTVQVYLYVADVARALREAWRVLRPGGRIVVVDTDWDSCVWWTADRDRHRRVMEARLAQFTNPHLPPALPGLLRGAGFHLEHAEVIPVLELDYTQDSFSGDLIPSTADLAARHGVSRAEADAWKGDLLGRTAPGQYFFSVNRYLFRATKLVA